MIKESTSNKDTYIIYLTEKEIENIYWYHKCHKATVYELLSTPVGIGDDHVIRESGNPDTEYNITDIGSW